MIGADTAYMARGAAYVLYLAKTQHEETARACGALVGAAS
ncbi:MAG: hypothetical protein GPOALKHO_001543 [Sodalis sp.]|nr:MAG: hypothetical protein GPOALKHO_001543 [Sodalis sp.]